MRVAINGLFADRPQTGSGQYTIQLIRHLLPLVERVHVVVPEETARTAAKYLKPDPKLTMHQVRLPFGSRLGKIWFEQVGFPATARRLRPDLAHIPYFGSGLWCPVPTVVTVHDVIMLVLPVYRESFLVRQYTQLVGSGARRTAVVLCDSDCTRRDVLRHIGVDVERVDVVPLAVDDRFASAVTAGSVAAARERYGLDDRSVLYVGGLDWRKNLATLAGAISLTRQDARLVIAGQPHTANSRVFPDVRPLIRRLGVHHRVRWIGWVSEEEKGALYAAARVFAFPSRYEGFGLTPLEAMAAGAPVVCSNASSLPEVVGDAAVLVSPDDVAGFAGAIDRLIDDEGFRATLIAQGRRRAAMFRWTKTAELTVAAYRRAVAGLR